MSLATQKVYVNYVSMENAVGDYEPRVEASYADDLYEDEVLDKVSGEKREIVERLMRGENFLSIAKELGYKESQIYKIKRELAEIYRDLHDTNKWDMVKGVLRLHLLYRLKTLPDRIHQTWEYDKCLGDYDRPSKKLIKESLEELIVELGGGRVLVQNTKIKRSVNTIPVDQLPLFT